MNERVVRLLHVEDDAGQQVLVRRLLERVPGYRYEVVPATGEEEAVAAFHPGVQAVVLDYHLANGNGLSCLRRLRRISPHVPIVALSSTESPAVAAELLAAGADDFFNKHGLDPTRFGAAIGNALARAAAWGRTLPLPADPRVALARLGRRFLSALDDDFFAQVDEFERVARAAGLTPAQIEPAAADLTRSPDMAARLRPLLLEIMTRLAD